MVRVARHHRAIIPNLLLSPLVDHGIYQHLVAVVGWRGTSARGRVVRLRSLVRWRSTSMVLGTTSHVVSCTWTVSVVISVVSVVRQRGRLSRSVMVHREK